MRIEDAAYSAGLLDGEGSIHIGGKGATCNLQIQITNTNLDVLGWLKNHWGGAIYELKGHSRGHDWARCWVWALNNRAQKRAFLEAVIPFLIIKRYPAELGLRFLSIRIQSRGRRMALDVVAQRQALAAQYRASRNGHIDASQIEIEDPQLAMEVL